MARKKRARGNGMGTVAPRRNRQGKIIGYRGAYFGPDGKRRWVSAKTKSECWRVLRQAMSDADRGVHPGPANLTVGQYLEASWLGDIEGTIRRHTYEQYKCVVNKHLVPEIGRTKLKQLSRPAIRKLYRERSNPAFPAARLSTSTLPCTKRSKTLQKTGLSAPTPHKA